MVPGIDIVGPLPEGVQSVTVFTGGVSTTAKNPDGGKGAAAISATHRKPRRWSAPKAWEHEMK